MREYSLTSWGLTCNSNDRNWYIPWPSIALSIMPLSSSDNMSLPMVRHFLGFPWNRAVWFVFLSFVFGCSFGWCLVLRRQETLSPEWPHPAVKKITHILDYTKSMLKGWLYKGNFREASATFNKHGYLNLFYQCLIVLFSAIVIIVLF